MPVQRFTLVADGTSDGFLLPIIQWTLVCAGVHADPQFADPRRLPKGLTLAEKLTHAVDRFPCEVLFVHRDAEAQPMENRLREIRAAFTEAARSGFNLPAVALIPVRMSEAWLCLHQQAIRKAAGNPSGIIRLPLPKPGNVESEPDPKETLHEALRIASELGSRRRKSFSVHHAVHEVARNITDFSPLRILPSFQLFEAAVRSATAAGWRSGLYPESGSAT
jgi:hypothetical protein